ncbi:MAG: MlaD family protein [Gemmatimonadales bacterium]|jgi:phospholipid/cholesterol/gamma-HCH transport system substrate-binding protein
MDLYYKQELTVGALVLVALAILIGGLMWLTGRSIGGRGRVEVPVHFGTVSGLTEGDPVQISGVSVGRVATVRLQEVGNVLVTLEVDERVRPRVDARAEVRPLDFLGAKYVAYYPGGAEEYLPEDGVVPGIEETDLAQTAVRLTDEATRTLIATQRLMSTDLADQIQRTMAATERAMDVVTRVGRGAVSDSVMTALGAVRGAARALDSTLASSDMQQSIAQLDEITEGVSEMAQGLAAVTQNLAVMLELMRSPDGTVGKILTDSTLHTDMHEVLVSLRLLLDDIRERPGRYVNVSVF